MLNGTPSIVVGVFAWTWIVAPQKHFSGFAGSVALAMLMIPMVHAHHRGDDQAGAPLAARGGAGARLPALAHQPAVVLRTALPGIVTGACSRWRASPARPRRCCSPRSGSQYMSSNLNQPMAALPLVVFTYATGPYEEWHRLAWAAALVLILVVFVLSIGARLATRRWQAQWLSDRGARVPATRHG